MDHSQQRQQQQQSQQRELVFCHQCENEWYRDEHGIVCPECQSDFTEIIEADHDPREEDFPSPLPQEFFGPDASETLPPHFFAPDPDEGDIDDLHWHNHGAGQPSANRYSGTFTRNITLGRNGQQHGGGPGGGGILGLIGPAIQGLLGGQTQRQQQNQQNELYEPARGAPTELDDDHERGHSLDGQQQYGGSGSTFTRHASGPGFSYTFTTSSHPNLFPRNPHGPQPFQGQPDQLEQMISQMFANIVPMHGGHSEGFPARGAGGMYGPPFMGMGGQRGFGTGQGPMPLGQLFQMFGVPPGGVHGDGVYTQEALDRVLTQLMEQHQSGNAPGPATAEAIDGLPRRPISSKDLGENGKADCSICMDAAELGTTVTELPCGHWFHHDCIEAWLREHDTCPHCRQGIMPKDGPNNTRPRQPSQAPLNDMQSPEHQRPYSEYPCPSSSSSAGEGSGSRDHQTGGPAGGIFGRMRQAFNPGGSNQQSGHREADDRNPQGR